MEGLSPDNLSLGRLVRKLAQEQPVAQQYANQGIAPNSNYGSRDYRQGFEGTQNIPQLVQSGLSSLAGPEAGTIGMFLTMLMQGPLANRGIDVMQRFETQYGASPDAVRQAAAVMNEMRGPSMAEAGASVGRMASALDQGLSRVTGGAVNGFVQGLWNKIPGDDATKGMFVSQLAMSDPQIADTITKMDPKLVLDFTPLVDATYMRNGGHFNPQDFRQITQSFMQMRDNNQLGAVPAQVAINSVPFAIKHIGPQVNAAQISNLSQMAVQAQQNGLAPTYGQSLEMLDSFGGLSQAAKNPAGTMQYLSQLKQRIQSSGLDEREVPAMMQEAKNKGIPVRTLIEGRIGGAEAAKLFRDNPLEQQQVQSGALDSYANLGHADSVKALTVMSQRSPQWKATIDKAIASGNSAQLNQLAASGMRDPSNWRLMHVADTSDIMQQLSNSPGASSGLMIGEAQRFAHNTNNLQLGNLLNNKAEMTRRLTTKDYSGLSYQTVNALSQNGQFGGRLGASWLAANANTMHPSTAPVAPIAPLPRIGVQYGEPAKVPQPTPGAAPVPGTPGQPVPLPKLPTAPVEPNALGAV